MNLSYELYKQYFDELWLEYPRKEAKEPAYLEYNRLITIGEVDQDDLIDKIKRYAYHMRFDHKYVITLVRWLKDKRWQDELPLIPVATTDDLNKAYNVVVKMGSGFHEPDKTRWLKAWVKANPHEALLEKLSVKNRDMFNQLIQEWR